MAIDRSSFLLMTGALAAGGAGGYYAHQQGWIGNHASPAQPAVDTVAVERTDAGAITPAPVQPVVLAAPIPACDDSVGNAAECPGPGMPTEEGGCGNFVTTRCQDFKTSLKPKVAEAAVQCLTDLKPQERCDKNRVNLCGHLALTNACMESDPNAILAAAGQPGTPPAASGAVVTTTANVTPTPPAPNSAAALCESIVKTAGPSRTAPTLADCKQTLSGMNDTGRSRMVECMRKNWNTKGLLGCEAMDPAKLTN